ncbi:MAG: fibronectin type III domain-containing protein [Planctomycetes bacterium]|nr:fibronectin type III domain-containing protein [Planctomycetota bacterium]
MRRERSDGPWADVATALLTEVTLVDQPRSMELEYRVIAVNKAGEGQSSNTEIVVM